MTLMHAQHNRTLLFVDLRTCTHAHERRLLVRSMHAIAMHEQQPSRRINCKNRVMQPSTTLVHAYQRARMVGGGVDLRLGWRSLLAGATAMSGEGNHSSRQAGELHCGGGRSEHYCVQRFGGVGVDPTSEFSVPDGGDRGREPGRERDKDLTWREEERFSLVSVSKAAKGRAGDGGGEAEHQCVRTQDRGGWRVGWRDSAEIARVFAGD